jgi:hypothetical protein
VHVNVLWSCGKLEVEMGHVALWLCSLWLMRRRTPINVLSLSASMFVLEGAHAQAQVFFGCYEAFSWTTRVCASRYLSHWNSC